jgi:hypothetical protein
MQQSIILTLSVRHFPLERKLIAHAFHVVGVVCLGGKDDGSVLYAGKYVPVL